jgi:hypothetical protein
LGPPHVLHILTEDDGEGGADYFFDDHFLQQSGHLASFLLNEDWRLPSGCGNSRFEPSEETEALQPGGEGAGVTYIALLTAESKYPLDDLTGGYRIEALRLPELSRQLLHTAPVSEDWRYPLRLLPPLLLAGASAESPVETAFLQAIRADPGDAVNGAAWSDWREERGAVSPGIGLLRGAFERITRYPRSLIDRLPAGGKLRSASKKLLDLEEKHSTELLTSPRSLFHVEDHLAQLCLHMADGDYPYFHQWILFDDMWASAHPDLANAILRFARRWDVLSAD